MTDEVFHSPEAVRQYLAFARAGAVLGSGEVKHGGKRAGAGRKPAFDVKWLLRLSKEQRAKVKALGGAEWLRGVINRA